MVYEFCSLQMAGAYIPLQNSVDMKIWQTLPAYKHMQAWDKYSIRSSMRFYGFHKCNNDYFSKYFLKISK